MTLPVALTSEIQKLAPSAIVELFVLDATSLGGEVLRFHAGTNQLNQNVVWQGETYVRYPIRVSGFELNGQGQLPRPKLQVSNILAAITQIVSEFNDLLGAKLTRKRTMAKFLDAVNFTGGVNADEDPTAEFSEDIYYIDRKSSENREMVEFELAASVDLIGVTLPRRQVIQNICIWTYRSAECAYAGAPLYALDDTQLTTTASVLGQAVLSAFAAVLAAEAALVAAETALSAAAVAMGSACDYVLTATTFDESGFDAEDPSGSLISGVYSSGPVPIARLASVTVSLGATYRIGALQGDHGGYQLYSLETWAINSGSCSAATTAYNTALTTRNTRTIQLATADTNLETALSALPDDDALWSEDRCGKRLSSCRLRFRRNAPLSFGSFPAAGLIR